MLSIVSSMNDTCPSQNTTFTPPRCRLRAVAGPGLPLIGVGGIDSPEVAWERIGAGASLIQLYTGWIYEGPELVPAILEGLSQQLDRHGFRNISEAVGSGAPWR